MGRENKRETVAALHREQIMKAAERLFSEKGYTQTTIEDIAKASEYSRRTIYSYYKSKEDMLQHIVEKGLMTLKLDIARAVAHTADFVDRYQMICAAMMKYQTECPHSSDTVTRAKTHSLSVQTLSDTEQHILLLGTEINDLLAAFIEEGQKSGIVRQEVTPMLTVYVLWSSITALLTLADTKGQFICRQFSISENEFLRYGFTQIINSILEERI